MKMIFESLSSLSYSEPPIARCPEVITEQPELWYVQPYLYTLLSILITHRIAANKICALLVGNGRRLPSYLAERDLAEMASASDLGRPISANHDDEDQPKKEEPSGLDATPKKPGLLKRVWTAVGLDPPTIIVMIKGGLAPVISLAALRSTTFAEKYSTLGYLVAIMSLLGFAIMPRAKFIQSMVLNIVSSDKFGLQTN
jgi:hypothetical protein